MKTKILLSILLLSIAVPALSATATFTFTCDVMPVISIEKITSPQQIAFIGENFATDSKEQYLFYCTNGCNVVEEPQMIMVTGE